MWVADQWKEYEIIDCSKGEKLERWGDYILLRPDPQVLWDLPRKKPAWKKLNGHYHRSNKGGSAEAVEHQLQRSDLSFETIYLQTYWTFPRAGGELGLV